uniref:Uncharacterized protein n=1 Tax=Hyaloperonospora arabidopsidis (strain Emoy2) TaxID=559515 RepID=M4BSY2_HYAAE
MGHTRSITRTLIAPPVPGVSVDDAAEAAALALALTGLQFTESRNPNPKRLSDARACDSRSSSTARESVALVSGAGWSDSAPDMLCVLLVGFNSRVLFLVAMTSESRRSRPTARSDLTTENAVVRRNPLPPRQERNNCLQVESCASVSRLQRQATFRIDNNCAHF